MNPLLAEIEPGTSAALYLFAIAGLVIAMVLVIAGLMARRTDHKAARFYLKSSAVCCGVAVLLILIAHVFGKDSQ
jgi:MFS-type transporter involved in bile tolerance (Atg22 family)